MPGFSDLPDEISLYILELVAREASLGTKYNLPLVSRQFLRIATPLLYHDVVLQLGEDEDEVRDVHFKLLRTLLCEPTKAALVQSFAFESVEFDEGARLESADEAKGYLEAHQSDLDELLKDIERLSGDESEEERQWWVENLVEEPFMPLVLALTLARLPNLSRLQMMDCAEGFWIAFRRTLLTLERVSDESKSVFSVLNQFPSLKSVQVGGE